MKKDDYDGDVCSHKHSFILDNFIRRIFQNPVKIVGEYLKEGDTAIDIGCGPGFFTIDMAKITGREGRVYAVDLQPEMLEKVKRKASKLNIERQISLHRCPQEKVGLPDSVKADFILAFYMLHETPDSEKFLKEIKNLLKEDGKVLIVEPKFHVSEKAFKESEESAVEAGFRIIDRPKKKGGRSMLLGL